MKNQHSAVDLDSDPISNYRWIQNQNSTNHNTLYAHKTLFSTIDACGVYYK